LIIELFPCRDTWVKKIEAASKHYLETERKKREKAHSGKACQADVPLVIPPSSLFGVIKIHYPL
jgi:hypothetical protein